MNELTDPCCHGVQGWHEFDPKKCPLTRPTGKAWVKASRPRLESVERCA